LNCNGFPERWAFNLLIITKTGTKPMKFDKRSRTVIGAIVVGLTFCHGTLRL
jgi:hypothetical protein